LLVAIPLKVNFLNPLPNPDIQMAPQAFLQSHIKLCVAPAHKVWVFGFGMGLYPQTRDTAETIEYNARKERSRLTLTSCSNLTPATSPPSKRALPANRKL